MDRAPTSTSVRVNKPNRTNLAPIRGRQRISQSSQRVSAAAAAVASAASTQRESQSTAVSPSQLSGTTIRNGDGNTDDSGDNLSQAFQSTPASQISTGTVVFRAGAGLKSFESQSEITVEEEEDDEEDGRRTVVPFKKAFKFQRCFKFPNQASHQTLEPREYAEQQQESDLSPTDTADEPELESSMEEALKKFSEIFEVLKRFTDSGELDAQRKEDMTAWVSEQVGTEFADACTMPIDRSEIIDDLDHESFSDLSTALCDFVFNARKPTAQNFTVFWDRLLEEEQIDLPSVLAIFNVFIHGALQMDGSSTKEKKIGLQCACCFMLLVGISGRSPNDRMRQTWKLDKIAYESILNNCCQLAKCYKPTPKLQPKAAAGVAADQAARKRRINNNAADDEQQQMLVDVEEENPADLSDLAMTLYTCILKALEMYSPRSLSIGMNNVILRTALKAIEIYLRLLPPPSHTEKCAVVKKYSDVHSFNRTVIGRDDSQTEQLFITTLTALDLVLRNSVKRIKSSSNDAAALLLNVQEDLKLKIMLIYLQMMPILTLLDENRKSYGAKLTAAIRKRSEAVAMFLLSVTRAYYAELVELDERCEMAAAQNEAKRIKRAPGNAAAADAANIARRKRRGSRLFLHVMMQMVVCSPDNRDARIHMNGIVMRFWRLFGSFTSAAEDADAESDSARACNEEQLNILMAYQQLACKPEVAARAAALEFATSLLQEPVFIISTPLLANRIAAASALPFENTYDFAKAIVCSGLQSPSQNLRSFSLTCFKSVVSFACKSGATNRELMKAIRVGYNTDAECTAAYNNNNSLHRLPSLRCVFTQYLLPQINDANGRIRRAVLGLVSDVAVIEPSIIDSVLIDALRERFRDPGIAVRRQVVVTVEALLQHQISLTQTSSSRSVSKLQHVLAKLYLETVVKILFDSDQQTRDLALSSMESFILLPMSATKFKFPDLHAEESATTVHNWLGDADASTQLAWHMCGLIARDASGDMLRCLEEAVDEWSKDHNRKGPKAKRVDQLNSLLMSGAKWLAETATQRNNLTSDADVRLNADDPAFYTSAVSQELTVWCFLAMMSGYDTSSNTLKCAVALDFLFSNRIDNNENDAASLLAHDHHLQQLPGVERNIILGHVLQFIIHKARSMTRADAERYRDELKANFSELADCDSSHICSAIRCMRVLCESASGRTQSYEYNDAADTRNVSMPDNGGKKNDKNNNNKSSSHHQVDVDFFQWARREAYASFDIIANWLEASPYLSANSSHARSTRPSSPLSSRAVMKMHASLPLPTVEQVVRALRALAELLTHSIHLLKNINKEIRDDKDMKDTIAKRDAVDDKQYLVEVIAVMCHFNSPLATNLLVSQKQPLSRKPSSSNNNSSRVTNLTPESIEKYQRKVDSCYEIRANALLALGRSCLLKKDWVVTYAPDYVSMLLDARVDDGLRCTCLQVLMDLYKRHSDTVERYLPRMTQCIGDAHASTRLRETAVQNLQHMLRTDLLRYDGQFIFEVLAALPEAINQSGSAQNREFSRNVETILTTLSDSDAQKWLNYFLRAVLFFNGYVHHMKFDDALRAQVNAAKLMPSNEIYVFKLAGDSNRRRRRLILQFMLKKMRDFSKIMLIPRVMEELVSPACGSELPLDESLTSALTDIFELMSTEKNMRINALDRQQQNADGDLAAGQQPDTAGGGGGGGDAAALMAEIADDEQAEKRKIDEEKVKAQLETTLREISLHRVVPVLASFNSIVRIRMEKKSILALYTATKTSFDRLGLETQIGDLRLHRALLKYTKFVVDSPMMCCKPEDFDEALLMTPGLDRAQIACFRQDLKKYGREVALRRSTRANDDENDSDDFSDDEDVARAAATTAAVAESQPAAAANRLARRTLLDLPNDPAAVGSQQTRAERQKAIDEKRRRTRTDLAQLSLHERTLLGGASLSASVSRKQQPQQPSPTASPVVAGRTTRRTAGQQFITPLPPSKPDSTAATVTSAAVRAKDAKQKRVEGDEDENETTLTNVPRRIGRRGRVDAETSPKRQEKVVVESSAVTSAEPNNAAKRNKNGKQRRVLIEDQDDNVAHSITPTSSVAQKDISSKAKPRGNAVVRNGDMVENARETRRRNTGSTSGEDNMPQRAVSTPKRGTDSDAGSAVANGSIRGGKKTKGAAAAANPGDLTFNADISGIKNISTMRSIRRPRRG